MIFFPIFTFCCSSSQDFTAQTDPISLDQVQLAINHAKDAEIAPADSEFAATNTKQPQDQV